MAKNKKYTSLSDYLNISSNLLSKKGVFDLDFPRDNRYFVDIFLIKGSSINEFRNSYDTFMRHFTSLTNIMKKSRSENDSYSQIAINMATFRENKGFLLGYSDSIGGGSGIGTEFAKSLVDAISNILEIDIEDPEAYMFIPFIKAGIGCDRISDMTCSILVEDFAKYTQRILKEIGFTKTKKYSIGTEHYDLAPIPWNLNEPLLFVPKVFIRRLPSYFDWEDMFNYYSLHNSFRKTVSSQLANIVGHEKFKNKKNISKDDLQHVLIHDPNLFKAVISEVQKSFPLDIELSNAAKSLCANNPIELGFNKKSKTYCISVVRRICDKFKELVEQRGVWRQLYQDYSPLHEEFAQKFFHAVASGYCDLKKVDIVPEFDTGSGRVDFRFMTDVDSRILVEMKLSTNRYLKSGYEKQLPTYIKSIKPSYSIYLIVKVLDYSSVHPIEKNSKKFNIIKKQSDNKVEQINKMNKESKNEKIELCIVDAYPRTSASKRH